MKRKAEIQEAYNDAVKMMQKMDVLNDGHEVERCAGFQDALIWVLGRSQFHAYLKGKVEYNIEDRI